MKLKILALGNEEMTHRMENCLNSQNMEVTGLHSLPDNVSNIQHDRFNLAIVDYKEDDLKNTCFRIIWLGRTRVAVLTGRAQEDFEDYHTLGVDAFLPESSGEAELAADIASIATKGNLVFAPIKVMVIEDDKYIREAIRLCFKIFWPEAETKFADDGQSGIDTTRSYSPDIILLDLGLPDITGYDVIERIKPFNKAPIIILSATRDKENIVRAIQSGATDYIIKPFKQIELIPRIKKYVTGIRR
jgi:DNA-binding response OmpR family regulator